MDRDISYLLYWDDDSIPIDGNMTFGNHLDNDIVVPGEDVADFHARVDLSDRGPVFIPLGTSTISVNGREHALPVQVIIGDVIGIGQATMQIGYEIEARAEGAAESWGLYPDEGDVSFLISGEVSVGRADTADISIPKEHVSRAHARLVERDNFVWLQDLHSANGTRINNTLLQGGARLYHGDYVSFDSERFQLIGKGGDLTPVETFIDPLRGTSNRPPSKQLDTTEFTAIEERVVKDPQMPELSETGAFLLGISESVDGSIFRVGLGESLIGRSGHCQIVIDDTSISHEHAQINIKPEGVSLTNLMSTNGTKVNGADITSAQLKDGDVVRLGRVSMVYKDIPPAHVDRHPMFRRASLWMISAAAAVAFLLVLTWIF